MTRADMLMQPDAGALRVRARITLQTVATALGVRPMTVWRWENRKAVPMGDAGSAYRRFIAGLARHEAVDAETEGHAA